jgi:c-di-GMP-binding flagellar brake protein YcgR
LHVDIACWADSRQLHGLTWNMSQGGIQVDIIGLNPGDNVRVSFRLPGSGTMVDASGSVVWVNEKRQGIRFEHLSPKHDQTIRDFITEVEAQEARG